jgi:rhodanese-related sulfurtransferase
MSKVVYIDVRDEDEFRTEHLKGAINLPLKTLATSAQGVLDLGKTQEVKLICLTGTRSGNALKQLKDLDESTSISSVPGGLNDWSNKADLVQSASPKLSLMRQVMIIAGALVLGFSLMGLMINILWLWGSAFVGAGLLFAGLSGICLMAIILNKMPWN